MFERSWVQIPATVYWLDIFSHLFIVKLYWMFEKTKNKWKEAGVGPFFKQFPAEKLATSSRSKTRKKLSRRWFQHFNEMLNFILNWQQQLSSQRLLPGGPPPTPTPPPTTTTWRLQISGDFFIWISSFHLEMCSKAIDAGASLIECHHQCDQIGRFIGLWATFQSLWQ